MAVREDLGRDTAPRLQSQKFQSQANAFSFGEHSTCSSAVADTAHGFVCPKLRGVTDMALRWAVLLSGGLSSSHSL